MSRHILKEAVDVQDHAEKAKDSIKDMWSGDSSQEDEGMMGKAMDTTPGRFAGRSAIAIGANQMGKGYGIDMLDSAGSGAMWGNIGGTAIDAFTDSNTVGDVATLGGAGLGALSSWSSDNDEGLMDDASDESDDEGDEI